MYVSVCRCAAYRSDIIVTVFIAQKSLPSVVALFYRAAASHVVSKLVMGPVGYCRVELHGMMYS